MTWTLVDNNNNMGEKMEEKKNNSKKKAEKCNQIQMIISNNKMIIPLW